MKKKILNQIQHFPKKNKRNPKKYKKLIKKIIKMYSSTSL